MHMLSGAVLYFMINNQSSRRDVVHVVEAPFVTAWKRQWSDHQDDLFKWKALGPCSCRIAELFVQGYTYAVLADNDCQCFTDPFGPEAERCHRDPGPNRHFHFLAADTSRGLTGIVAHDAQLASGSRRYSPGSFRPSRSLTSLYKRTIPPVPDICIRARRPPVRVKSRHARSDVIVTDTNDNTSLHSFTFSSVIFYLEYRRLDSHLDVVPQDRCSCQARTSASLDGHRTSARLVDRVVGHPVYGREAYRLFYFYDSGRSISLSRAGEHFAELGLTNS